MAIDDKLFRIYEEAHSNSYRTKADLSRAVADKKLAEFSYERNGDRHYLTWSTVMEYVSLLTDYDLLTAELGPTIKVDRVSRRGFELTLGENVETYAGSHGFSTEKVRGAVRELLQRTPAQLPTPATVFAVLQLPVNYSAFHRALSVRAFQQRVGFQPKQKSVLIIPDILRE